MSKLGILCFAGAFLLYGGSAFSQNIGVDNNTNSASQAGSTAIAVSGGSNSPDRIRTTVPAFAPGLVAAGVHSCAGSTSVGVGATGWGFGFGSTYEMRECNRRAYAAALLGMGHRGAALDLICLNKEVRSALNATGVACASQMIAARAAATPPPRATRSGALLASTSDDQPVAAAPRPTRAAAQPPMGGNRKYSAKALGLSSSDLRAKGCVLRTNGSNGRAWHCPRPIM